jgi:hypothetical protein
MLRWPLRRRARLVAVPPPDVSAEILARLDWLEARQRASEESTRVSLLAIAEACRIAGYRVPGLGALDDTQEMPVILSLYRATRHSA